MESSPASDADGGGGGALLLLEGEGGGGGGALLPPGGGGGGGGVASPSHRVDCVCRKENCDGEIPAGVAALDPLVPMIYIIFLYLFKCCSCVVYCLLIVDY